MVILLVLTLKVVLLLAAVWSVCSAELITVEGYEGGKAEIRCPYREEWRSHQKYLCKGDCSVYNKDKVIKTEAGENSASKGRYSLKDNREESVFIVTITNLTLNDAGRYWCGEETVKWKLDNYVEVNLIVSEAAPTINTPKTEPTAATASNPGSPTPSSLATSISSTHNGSGTSVIIIVYMSMVTLLLVVSLLIVYRWKCNKETAVSALMVNTGINREGCHGDYEEMKGRPLQSNIYANLPTSPSESLNYASVNFHKDPSCPNEVNAVI